MQFPENILAAEMETASRALMETGMKRLMEDTQKFVATHKLEELQPRARHKIAVDADTTISTACNEKEAEYRRDDLYRIEHREVLDYDELPAHSTRRSSMQFQARLDAAVARRLAGTV